LSELLRKKWSNKNGGLGEKKMALDKSKKYIENV
jgi:hypothetical protein